MRKDKVTVKKDISVEKEELDAKIEKLSSFVLGTTYIGLGSSQKNALTRQLSAMNDYSRALRDRIIDITSQEAE